MDPPTATVIRLKPELHSQHAQIISAATEALSAFPVFEVDTLRMYRLGRPEGKWLPQHIGREG
ncbi:MAG TPA: hypothetical protein DEV93_22670 [Chloroflexi bacterium]|nr:hypothetical protein [Chloroflexota bacterium]